MCDIPLNLTIGNFIEYFFEKVPKLENMYELRYLDYGSCISEVTKNGILYHYNFDSFEDGILYVHINVQ